MAPIVTTSSHGRRGRAVKSLIAAVVLFAGVCTYLLLRLNNDNNNSNVSTVVDSNSSTVESTIGNGARVMDGNGENTNGTDVSFMPLGIPNSSSNVVHTKDIVKTAEPIKRRQRGTADIIEAAKKRGEKVKPDFDHPSENFFSLYARPGEPVAPPPLPDHFDEDAMKSLEEDIVIYDDDTDDVVELKCIVAGIKEELRAYLKEGGSVLGFVAELKARQAEEERIFSSARSKIFDLYKEGDMDKTYVQWLETNKELAELSILPVQLPRGMRKFQAELEAKFGKGDIDAN